MAFRIEAGAEPIPGYTLHSRLGSGGFGEVWKAEAPGGIFKAIKFIHGDLRDKTNDDIRFAEQELKALKRVQEVRHPFLLSLDRYDIIDGRLMITMELADCNLWEKFRLYRQQGYVGIPRDELIRLMSESAEVLDLMNDQYALQHLDIKPQNLFLLHNHVKVADFGQVKDLQGMGATVTGGITPVYAAPETFDGFVSRFCDQYSLACVYAELLTGQRPFDGTSMQQLLMQHLNQPPNLNMVSAIDRPAILKALAKKPEGRFPNIMSFVRALIDAGVQASAPRTITPTHIPQPRTNPNPAPIINPAETSARIEISLPDILPQSSSILSVQLTGKPTGGSSILSGFPIGSGSVPNQTPIPQSGLESAPLPRVEAPPEETGHGCIRPTLVIGLGGIGQKVIRHLRQKVQDKFNKTENVPTFRTLYIDTDGTAVEEAVSGRATSEMANIPADCVIHTKLNRASHYLKPRLSGRSLIEGWFDPTMLYRLPRNPVTLGIRIFGRLAYCDYFRNISQKISADISAAVHPDSILKAVQSTGQDLRTNRPRVYVVCGLAGGTGSGMMLDTAYTVKLKLKQLGYDNADVVGVLLVPPDGPKGEISPLAQANVYAALTELNHYANEETQFVASYDDRHSSIADPTPAFSQTILLSGPNVPVDDGSKSGSGALTARAPAARGTVAASASYAMDATTRKPSSGRETWPQSFHGRSGSINYEMRSTAEETDFPGIAADIIWYDSLSTVGPAVDEARAELSTKYTNNTFRTIGFTRFSWPRNEILNSATHTLSLVLFDGWVSPDAKRARGLVPGWTQNEWSRLGLDINQLLQSFREGVDKTLGGSVEGLFSSVVESLTPKGWLARLPDVNHISAAIQRVQAVVGVPSNNTLNSTMSPAETAIQKIATEIFQLAKVDFSTLIPSRVDDPNFRLAGAEEAARGFINLVDRSLQTVNADIAQCEQLSRDGYDTLMQVVYYQRGMAKPTNEHFLQATKDFPQARYRLLQLRFVADIYTQLKGLLSGLMNELFSCRKRLEMVRNQLAASALPPAASMAPRMLMPPNCETINEAVKRFMAVLGDNDLMQIEHQVQQMVEEKHEGVYQACLNQTNGVKELLEILREETRKHLNTRLGEVDLAAMFARRYPTEQAATNAITTAYHSASSRLVESGPWTRNQIALVVGPGNTSGETLRAMVAHAITEDTPLRTTDVPDELTIYREYPAVPLQVLSQLGPNWQNAYTELNESTQGTPHIRTDVMKWQDVDQ